MPETDPTQCILLTRLRRDDRSLRLLLEDRGWEVRTFDDAALAMAEVAVCERAQAARSAWGLQRVARVVLAIDVPDDIFHVSSLLAALKQYMPHVAVWDCSRGQLTPMSHPSIPAEPKPPSPAPTRAPSAQVGVAESAISRDELDMLLERGDCQL